MQKFTFILTLSLSLYFGANSYLYSSEKQPPIQSNKEDSNSEESDANSTENIFTTLEQEPETELESKLQSNQDPDQEAISGIEKSKDAIYQGAVNFARWVDRFFGERQELDDAGYDYLRMINRVVLVEGETVKYRPRIKAKVHLPQFNKKTSLLFSNDRASSGDESELEDRQTDILRDDENLSAAINYESDIYSESKFDFRLGIDSHFDTFAFVKHSMPLHESESLEIRNYNYLFWEEEQGFGLKAQIELNKVLDDSNLFRWKYSTLHAEKSEGTEWYNQLSLISRMSEEKWIAYEIGVNGATKQAYDVENYRLSVRFRNKTSVHWLYFEVEPEIRLIRTPESVDRELIAGVIFRLEIQFEKN